MWLRVLRLSMGQAKVWDGGSITVRITRRQRKFLEAQSKKFQWGSLSVGVRWAIEQSMIGSKP